MSSRFISCLDPSRFPGHLRGAVVAIGNFDGFHRGHQDVLAALKKTARRLGKPAVAMTFEPHPRDFFARTEPLLRLTDIQTKQRLAMALGLDGIVILKFDDALSQKEPKDFVNDILVRDLGCSAIVVGDNFRFGRRRRGDVDFLSLSGKSLGFVVQSLGLVLEGEEAISSTRVRTALASGDLQGANGLLGYRWFVNAQVSQNTSESGCRAPARRVLKTALANSILHGSYIVRGSAGPWPVEGIATVDLDRPDVLEFSFEEPVPMGSGSSVTLAFIERLRSAVCRSSTRRVGLHGSVKPLTPLDMCLGYV